jgi:hypothetical protein
LSAAVVVLFTDAILFRTGWYVTILEPDSYAGRVATLTDRSRRHPTTRSYVLVLGDSRIGEGFSARIAGEEGSSSGLGFFNASVPAASIRCQSYLLRWLSEERNWRAAVVTLDSYGDEDRPADHDADYLDAEILTPFASLADSAKIALSTRSLRAGFSASRAGLLRGFALRPDIHAFLSDPSGRLRKVAAYRESSAAWDYEYEGKDLQFKDRFEPPLPIRQTGELYRFRRRWLEQIRSLADSRRIPLIVARLPGTPGPRSAAGNLPSAVRDVLEGVEGVTVLPEGLFTDLERGDMFFDRLHLNAKGRREFSMRLARSVAAALRGS